ncbi:hypothetical protein BDN71DRAFT_1514313 [Pleurotus eryngii]|uniref:Uncharacterized protein n=1 Tax=Pleurotus eryngii TaxID=5323 RepID=A0A9P5ZJM9_PLEER|nr:hypothetical protein BDN71DRAFT_1514313 [Pleurotus eryngii]
MHVPVPEPSWAPRQAKPDEPGPWTRVCPRIRLKVPPGSTTLQVASRPLISDGFQTVLGQSEAVTPPQSHPCTTQTDRLAMQALTRLPSHPLHSLSHHHHPPSYLHEFPTVPDVLGLVPQRTKVLYTPIALDLVRQVQESREVTKALRDAPLLAPSISRSSTLPSYSIQRAIASASPR